jgi:hypothetical protein
MVKVSVGITVLKQSISNNAISQAKTKGIIKVIDFATMLFNAEGQ